LRFRTRIVLVLAVIGLLPLLVLGWLSFSLNREELERTVGGAHQATAVAAARACERWLAQSLEALQLSLAAISLDRLTPDEASTVLRIPYRQLDAIQIIVLLDEEGNALMPALVKRTPGQPMLDEGDLDLFARHVPLAVAIAAGTAIGPPFHARSGSARLAVALRAGRPAASPRVVAAQLSLDAMEEQMRELGQDGSVAFLVGRDGEVIAGAPGAPVSKFEQELIAAGTKSGRPLVRQLRRGDGALWLAAFAPLGDLGWGVVVAQPASSALRPADRVRTYTLFWAVVTLVLVALLGALLSRSLAEPIRQLSIAATALTEGRYHETARVDAGGELGKFADAFNHMAREVHRRDEEIRRWNAELQQRVDRGTLELRAAQDQILRSRRLAALGSMAAGIAHELNNPLTAISGAASMLREQLGPNAPQDAFLSILLEQSERVARLGSDLRQFADQERDLAGTRFPLSAPVLAAIETNKAEMNGRRIELATEFREALPDAQGDPRMIEQAVAHLVRNAIQAMPDGGKLTIRLGDVAGEALKLSVTDTGKGIPERIRERIFDPFFTTKERHNGAGLGLSIAHRVVLAHHGKLTVESVEGQGSTFTVLLPTAAAAAHLS
jgi:two-component system, NtrC family, sensor kinase